MFYCEPCRIKNNWPESFGRSRGPCEMCGKNAICWDRPSSSLPEGTSDETKSDIVQKMASDLGIPFINLPLVKP